MWRGATRWGSDDIPVPSNYEESNYDQHASESESNDTQPGLGGQGKGGGKEEIVNKSMKRKRSYQDYLLCKDL